MTVRGSTAMIWCGAGLLWLVVVCASLAAARTYDVLVAIALCTAAAYFGCTSILRRRASKAGRALLVPLATPILVLTVDNLGRATHMKRLLGVWSIAAGAGLHSCTCEREPAAVESASGSSEANVSQAADSEYQFTRTRVNTALAQLNGRNDCLLPFEREGKVVGIKLYGVKPDSLLGQAGIKNGDVIFEVNGVSTATAQGGLHIRGELWRANRLVVRLERDGRKLTFVYRITEERPNKEL